MTQLQNLVRRSSSSHNKIMREVAISFFQGKSYSLFVLRSPVAQQAEQVAVNHLVGGSIPSRGAIFSRTNYSASIVNATPRRAIPSGRHVSSVFPRSYALSHILLDSPVMKIHVACRVQSGRGLRTGIPRFRFRILQFSIFVPRFLQPVSPRASGFENF